MQVSWIDPEEIRALLAQIEGPLPRPAANNFAWELNTLPVVPMDALSADNMIEGPALRPKAATPAAQPPPPPPPSEFPMSERRSGPASGDLWRIRERLRSLREQAQESGILPRGEEQTAADTQPAPLFRVLPPTSSDEAPPNVEDPIAEFAKLIETPPPAPEAAFEPPVVEEPELTDPDALLPAPVLVFDPVEPPAPTPAPALLGPLTSEFPGSAPESAAYEPLFSLPPDVPASTAPPLEELAVETPPEPGASPFSIAEAEAETAPAPERAPFVVPALGLSDRLSALAQWATQRLGTSEVLLVDDYGDVLWGGHAQTPLVLSAMMAWHAAQRSTAESACNEPHRIDKDLANGRALTVLPARTRYGVVSLAAIQEKPMTPADEQAIRAALVLAVEGSDAA